MKNTYVASTPAPTAQSPHSYRLPKFAPLSFIVDMRFLLFVLNPSSTYFDFSLVDFVGLFLLL